MISPFALSVAMVLAGFYMLCRMMTTKKNYLSTAPAWCNKIINQSLTPYYQISESISSFIEKLFRTSPNSELKDEENATAKHGCSYFSAHQKGHALRRSTRSHIFTSRSIYRT
jgi:hypothetical protein